MTRASELAPIRKTQFARRLTRGGATRHRECWAAETLDGTWSFEREDSPGTPWLVYHQPSVKDGSYVRPVSLLGSLRQCRWYVASGGAQLELDRLFAHERGEHQDARDPRCGRC